MADLTGKKLSHYQILGPLGAGGMGEVYLAEDLALGRKVALKLLPARYTADEERVRRFSQEARAASSLNHPNIVTIYEIGAEEGVHYIATEYIDGVTLRDRLRAGPLALGEALDAASQVAQALSAAHEAGITHRDIKPENIMVRPDGYVKVLDFGLAKLTERPAVDPEAVTMIKAETVPGTVMGTFTYMSPEQARGLEVDARTDIFSLGVVLYEMISGRAPFTGPTPSDVIAAILQTEPGPLERTPGDLQRLVARALCKERDRRYQTMSDLGSELRRLRGRLEFEAQLAQLGLTRSGEEMASDRQVALFSLPPSAPAPEKRRARVRKAIDSLAVLPLANASPDPHMEYLSDGITESIINSLSQVPKLRILPRGTVFRYRGLEVDPLAAGQELGVRAVLTGRVMQLGESLIIRAELIDVANEAQLWGGQYRRRLTDIFALEEEIAREISAQLRHKLSGEERRRIIRRQTESAEAYQLYLKGRYYTNKRTGEWIQKGIEHFEQAIAIDPNYALAYAGLADAYGLLASATGGWAPREAYPRAKAAAERALALDETLGEAHCALGFFRLLYDWDDASAEREFARALELSPNYANAHDGYGFYLKATGQHEASIRACEHALSLDPLSLFMNLSLGWAYYFARQYDRALEQGHKALELDPHFGFAHWHCGLNYQQLGKYEEAVTAMQQAVLLSDGGPSFVAHLGHACGRAGREGEAREVLANLSEMARTRYVSSYFFALVHLGLGETAETLESLDRAYEERAGFLAFLDVEPLMDPLRAEPRFNALRARIRPAAV